jgi:hypothetical protein
MQIASEAQSAAHQIAETAAGDRIHQAEVNIDLRSRLDRIDYGVVLIQRELGEIRGEAKGQSATMKSALAFLGLAVGVIELLSHLVPRLAAHVG